MSPPAPSPFRRIASLLRLRLASGPRDGFPAAALLAHGLVGAVFCGLVHGELPPFAYGVFAFSLAAAFVALPLLGDLGWVLRADEAREWIEAQPLRPLELTAARALHLALLLWALSAAVLFPAAVLAPAELGWGGRALLPVLGLGLATLLAALLVAVQALLGGRAEALLVLFQTLLVVGVVVGLVTGMRFVPELAALESSRSRPWLAFLPPAWFAEPLAPGGRLWLPIGVSLAAFALLVLLPAPAPRARGGGEPWLARLLRPARRLASRAWVRRDERGAFDLVYDALPRERDVVLRTYPMIGIPLAFLLVASTGSGAAGGSGRGDVLALLIFTAGIYLPVLLTQVPASASWEARWLLDSAPVREGAVRAGTVKALAIRFLLPLYVLLGLVAWTQAGAGFALRLVPAGALASLAVLRLAYPLCVGDRPLSVRPDAVRMDLDWTGSFSVLAVGLTIGAVLAHRFVTTSAAAVALFLGLIAVEALLQRALRRQLG